MANLCGDLRYVGTTLSAAAVLDLALLARLVCLKVGGIYGAHLCQAAGVDAQILADLMQDGDPPKVALEKIAAEEFGLVGGSGSIDVGLAVTRSKQEQAQGVGIDTALPDLLVKYYQSASDAGFGSDDSASIIKAMRMLS